MMGRNLWMIIGPYRYKMMGITEEDFFDFLLVSIFIAPFVFLVIASIQNKRRDNSE